MMEKAYSLFLCVLLILVLFLPSTAAGRALLQTAETEGEAGYQGGNDRSKMVVTGSRSNTAPSRTGVSSPSGYFSFRESTYSSSVVCSQGTPYSGCFERSYNYTRVANCTPDAPHC